MRSRPQAGSIRLSTLLIFSLFVSLFAALLIPGTSWTELTPESGSIQLRGGRLLHWGGSCTGACVELWIENRATSELVWSSHFFDPVYVRFAGDGTILLIKEGSLTARTQAIDVRGGKAVSPP